MRKLLLIILLFCSSLLFADKRITELNELTLPAINDIMVIVDDVAGIPKTKKITLDNLFNQSLINHINIISTGTLTHAEIDALINTMGASTATSSGYITDLWSSTSTLEGYVFDLWDSTSTLEGNIFDLWTSTQSLGAEKLSIDGSIPMTGTLDMAGFGITNVSSLTAPGDLTFEHNSGDTSMYLTETNFAGPGNVAEIVFTGSLGIGIIRKGLYLRGGGGLGDPLIQFMDDDNSIRARIIFSTMTGHLDITTNNDLDDFLRIHTTGDQTTLSFVGQDGRITADSGTINFDDEDLTTTGLATVGTLLITDPDVDWKFRKTQVNTGTNTELGIQSQTSGAATRLGLFSKDGDGSDNVFLHIYGVGTPDDRTGEHRLDLGYAKVVDKYRLTVVKDFEFLNTAGIIYNINDPTGLSTFNFDVDILGTATCDELELLLGANQNYKFEADSNAAVLAIQAQASATTSAISLFAKDGDGTDNVLLRLWGTGTSASVAGSFNLLLGYLSSGNYAINAGSGELQITQGANTGQLVLKTNGDVDIGAGKLILNTDFLDEENSPYSNFDVSGINVLCLETDTGAITITGFIGGLVGQVLQLVRTDTTNTVTLEYDAGSGNQDIFLSDEVDETLTTFGGWTLVCDGSNWFEVDN